MDKEMLSKIKLVCSDVDGTLVEEGKGGLNPEYYDEIRRLKEKGIMFAVVSGRSYAGSSPLFAPVIDDVIFINDNGAVLTYQGNIIKSHSIPDELVKDMVGDLRDNYNVYTEKLVDKQNNEYYLSFVIKEDVCTR